jgi:hypothetical protein
MKLSAYAFTIYRLKSHTIKEAAMGLDRVPSHDLIGRSSLQDVQKCVNKTGDDLPKVMLG